MKNFKEKILKIGKRKNCFIALLLVALIAFGIVTGLNGSNSANSGAIKANAFTEAPQPKNLDLNGIRYTYQTSLNELKNQYGLFNKRYDTMIFDISNSTESNISLVLKGQEDNISQDSEDLTNSTTYINQAFQFDFTDNNGVKVGKSANFTTDINQTPALTNNVIWEDSELGSEPFNFDNLTSFRVNFSKLKSIPYFNNNVDDLTYKSFTMNFVYVKDSVYLGGAGSSPSLEEIHNNTINIAYAFSNQIEYYKFNLPRIQDYELRNIFCDFESADNNTDNTIYQLIGSQIDSPIVDAYSYSISLHDIKFIKNDENNVLYYKYNYEFNNEGADAYKGYILLSENKFDDTLINVLFQDPSNEAIIDMQGLCYFGGNFSNNTPSNKIILSRKGVGSSVLQTFVSTNNEEIRYVKTLINPMRIDYFNQSRLLYFDSLSSLKTLLNKTLYDGLSAQVEDILYNVQYIGDVEEIERNERIEEDLNNLLKLTGLGAVIGLLFGILFGNPALGLIVGGLFGFFTALFPLLIDGLQAIFGNNFLSGLYNFFKSITNFFGRIVDTFVNFLKNIITNPFILILIVIIAIIYIVKRYNK